MVTLSSKSVQPEPRKEFMFLSNKQLLFCVNLNRVILRLFNVMSSRMVTASWLLVFTICRNRTTQQDCGAVWPTDLGANKKFCKYFINRKKQEQINPLNPELNPICYLLALLGPHHFLHVSRIRVKSLTFRRLMSYIYMEHPFLMFLDHTTTQYSR